MATEAQVRFLNIMGCAYDIYRLPPGQFLIMETPKNDRYVRLGNSWWVFPIEYKGHLKKDLVVSLQPSCDLNRDALNPGQITFTNIIPYNETTLLSAPTPIPPAFTVCLNKIYYSSSHSSIVVISMPLTTFGGMSNNLQRTSQIAICADDGSVDTACSL